MEEPLSAQQVFALLGALTPPNTSVESFEIVSRSNFAAYPRRVRELAKGVVSVMRKHPAGPNVYGPGHPRFAEPGSSGEIDAVRQFLREGLPIDTVVYDQCDPALGLAVAAALDKMRSSCRSEIAAVPNLFSREYRLSSFDPRYEAYITQRRVLVVARCLTSGNHVANCIRACRELKAASVGLAAVANFGRSEAQAGSDFIRSLLLY